MATKQHFVRLLAQSKVIQQDDIALQNLNLRMAKRSELFLVLVGTEDDIDEFHNVFNDCYKSAGPFKVYPSHLAMTACSSLQSCVSTHGKCHAVFVKESYCRGKEDQSAILKRRLTDQYKNVPVICWGNLDKGGKVGKDYNYGMEWSEEHGMAPIIKALGVIRAGKIPGFESAKPAAPKAPAPRSPSPPRQREQQHQQMLPSMQDSMSGMGSMGSMGSIGQGMVTMNPMLPMSGMGSMNAGMGNAGSIGSMNSGMGNAGSMGGMNAGMGSMNAGGMGNSGNMGSLSAGSMGGMQPGMGSGMTPMMPMTSNSPLAAMAPMTSPGMMGGMSPMASASLMGGMFGGGQQASYVKSMSGGLSGSPDMNGAGYGYPPPPAGTPAGMSMNGAPGPQPGGSGMVGVLMDELQQLRVLVEEKRAREASTW